MTRSAVVLPCLILMALSAAGPGPAHAQSLEVTPRGTYLELEGPMSVRGRADVGVAELPEGRYLLRTDGEGLAAARTRLSVDSDGIRAERWASPTALLVPPGVDHLSKSEFRGWFHLLSGVVGATSLYFAAQDLDDAAPGSEAEFDKSNVRDLWTGYVTAIWLGAGIESWLLTPSPTVRTTATGIVVSTPRADRWNASWRSVLVPGSGQRFLGHDGRANTFTAAVALSAAGAIFAQDRYLDARREVADLGRALGNATDSADRARLRAEYDEAVSTEDTRNLLRWLAVGTAAYSYLWNVYDAFSLGRQAEAASGPKLGAIPTSDGFTLALSWRFH